MDGGGGGGGGSSAPPPPWVSVVMVSHHHHTRATTAAPAYLFLPSWARFAVLSATWPLCTRAYTFYRKLRLARDDRALSEV